MDSKLTRQLRTLVQKRPYAIIIFGSFAVLATWQLLASIGLIAAEDWSSPTEITSAVFRDLISAQTRFADQNLELTLFQHIAITIGRWLSGFFLAAVLGIFLGFALGNSPTLFSTGYPVANFLRALPSAAIWPVSGLLVGFSRSQLIVITFGALWPILINTMEGVRRLPSEARDSLRFMKLERWRRWLVKLQWSSGDIFTGLEIGGAVAFLLTVTVEIFWPTSGGIGWYLDFHSKNREQAQLFGGIFVSALLGWAINTSIRIIRVNVLFWERGTRRRQILRLRSVHAFRGKQALSRIADPLLSRIIVADNVTETVQHMANGQWRFEVLRNLVAPYLFPPQLTGLYDAEALSRLVQRDIRIIAPVEGVVRTALFARSWIDLQSLPAEVVSALEAGHETIGEALRKRQVPVSYRHLGYRSTISTPLGSVFSTGGSVEVVERSRALIIEGKTAIYIQEYVPVLDDADLSELADVEIGGGIAEAGHEL